MPTKTHHTTKTSTKRGGTHVSQNVKVTVNTAPPPRRRRRRKTKKVDPTKQAMREAAAAELMEELMGDGGGGGGGSAPAVAQVSTPSYGAIEGAMSAMERRILQAERMRPGGAPAVAAAAAGPAAPAAPPAGAPGAAAAVRRAAMAGGGGAAGGRVLRGSPLTGLARNVRFDPAALATANPLGTERAAWDESGRTGVGAGLRRRGAGLQRDATGFDNGEWAKTAALDTRNRAYPSALRGDARPPVLPLDGSHVSYAGGSAAASPGTPGMIQKLVADDMPSPATPPPPGPSPEPTCLGKNRDGARCKRKPAIGKKYCYLHKNQASNKKK